MIWIIPKSGNPLRGHSAVHSGQVNSISLSSQTIVDKNLQLKLSSTHSLNPLVVVPIPEIKVERGDQIKLKVGYRFGGGYNNFKINRIN